MTRVTTRNMDFDAAPDRRGGDSLKWNRYRRSTRDVIGAWVADMDFPSPGPVLDALRQRLDGPALGYSVPSEELIEVVVARMQRLYSWRVDSSWLVLLPGVVPGLFGAARAVGQPGSAVITQSPNYQHFFGAAEYSGRALLRLENRLTPAGRWEMDFNQLRELAGGNVGSFLLCNPHNPVGRILSEQELQTVADTCLRHDIVICSDEVHADLLLDTDKPHIPIASLSAEVEQRSITLVSPSKAFNMPGIGGFALAIIPDPDLRRAFEAQVHGLAVYPGALALTAALAAYRDSSDWLDQLLDYLRGNRDYLQSRVASIDGLSMTHVEATFLGWINVGELGLGKPFQHFLAHGVALSDGAIMGDDGYLRLNFACTRATLEEILDRMERAVNAL